MTEVLGTLTGGVAAAERAAKEKAEREKNRSSSYKTWSHFSLTAAESGQVYGESKVLRLVTDEPDWAEVKQHSFVPTKPKPSDYPEGRKWPVRQGGVCRYTLVPKRATNGQIVVTSWYDDCFICDEVWVPGKEGKPDYHPKGSPRSWAWAVERELVNPTDPESGYQDVMVEVQIDGETKTMQKWVVLNFAMENFFDKFLGYRNVYGTVVDRDYKITRKGSGTDTDYEIIALDPQFVEGVKIDLRKDQFKDAYQPPVELFSIIAKQASDEHYEWFFDTRVESSYEKRFGKKDGNAKAPSQSSTSESTASASESGEDEAQHKETLNAMRERLKNKNKS